jgi:hypothetical protein
MQSVSKIDSTTTVTHKPMEFQHTSENITKTKKRKINGPRKHKSTGQAIEKILLRLKTQKGIQRKWIA